MKPYTVQLEIAGPTGMWTRPDTRSTHCSHVAPVCTARSKSLSRPVEFHRNGTNSGRGSSAEIALTTSPGMIRTKP